LFLNSIFNNRAFVNDRDRVHPTSQQNQPQAASGRRVVGVVRVLRGKLGAPCRICSEASAEPVRPRSERRP
jgi:hypothetical protein